MLLILGMNSEAMAQNQKYGYLNSQELILLLPESKVADDALAKYQEGLAAKFQEKVTKFQTDVKAFEETAARGTLNKNQIGERSAALQKRQEALGKEEYDLGQQVNEKRAELLKPILEKIDTAIKAVGKEGNYTMIFDSSGMNVMLYHDESTDVMALVKAKLGL